MLRRLAVLTACVLVGSTAVAQTTTQQTPNITFGGGFTQQQQNDITAAHLFTLEQVNTAIAFLQGNRNDILAGTNTFYNQTFGNFYSTDPVSNPLLGTYAQTQTRYELSPLYSLGAVDPTGSSPVLTSLEPSNFFFEFPPIATQTFFIGGELVGANGQSLGLNGESYFIQSGTLDEVVGDGIFSIGNSGKPVLVPEEFEDVLDLDGADFGDIEQTLFLDPVADRNINPTFGLIQGLYRIKDEDEVGNSSHYDQTLNAFLALRDELLEDTTYLSQENDPAVQAILATVFAPGAGAIDLPGLTLPPGYSLDQAFRMFGNTNSGSPEHLQNLADIIAAIIAGQDPPDPLLAVDDDLVFFNNLLTAVAASGVGGNAVVVGGAFLSGQQTGVSPNQTTTPGSSPLLNNTPNAGGTLATGSQASMIAAALLELTGFAGFGVLELFGAAGDPNGNGIQPFPQNLDAQNLAGALFSGADGGFGGGGIIRPEGKNTFAQATDGSTIGFSLAIPTP